ncbi:putative peptidoglycan muropeptide transporter SLC46 [Arctopsyche grandis]|uniref:putative peptidoglycan muropeptide transporter SLC46 n=1 Tax=Arctopsyche grandis TaxID=121162 RepID=UPI00406D6A6A
MAELPESITTPEISNANKYNVLQRFVEIPVFVYFFAYALSESVCSNLILYKICKSSYNYNETICAKLVSSHDDNTTIYLEELMQPQASMIIMCKTLIEAIFPAIISLFLGPWSDMNGRKPLILSSSIGHLFYFVLLFGYVLLDNVSPWYLILASIPFSLMGASTSMITGSFCYVSDITNVSNRSYRMGILESALLFGILFGSLSSSYAYNALDYTGVFAICIVIALLGIFSTVLLEESLTTTPNNDERDGKIFDRRLVVDMITTCFKVRAQYRRAVLWLIMLACTSGILVMQGDAAVSYLFTREKLRWKLEDYTVFGAYNIVTTIVGVLIVALIFQKWLKMEDTIVSMISYFSAFIRAIIIIFVSKSWHMYLGASICCLRAVSGPINRAILTKIVPTEDAGKVLSLTTSLETIVPLISTPIYSFVYQNTLTTFPAAFNIMTAILYGLSFFLLMAVEVLLKKYPGNDYENLLNIQNEI